MAQVSQAMTRGVRSMAPDESIMKAAQAMSELGVGVIPVCRGRRLVGLVTDRDLVLRGLAQGLDARSTPVEAVMTTGACWCFEDQSLEEAVWQMEDQQIRRLPVVDRDRQLVGMLSLGNVATRFDAVGAGAAPERISQPPVQDGARRGPAR